MSQLTIVSNSSDLLRVAIYKKPYRQPTLNTIAWKIVAPPPDGGQTTVEIPDNYSVFVNYSFDPAVRSDPNGGSRTPVLTFDEATARFDIASKSTEDNRDTVAIHSRSFNDLVMNEVHLDNQAGFGVWGHIQKDGADIFPARVISPGRTLIEDVRSTLYLAVIDEFVSLGDRLVQEEISLTETPILEGQTATITGDEWQGYAIAVS